VWIAMAGLPGSGKSTLARGLAQELAGVLLDKDVIRSALFPPQAIEYSSHQDDFVVEIMFQVAAYLVEKEPQRPIILDGRPFIRRYQVERLLQAAHGAGTSLKILECVCRAETARRRLDRTSQGASHLAQNRDLDLYLAMKKQAEPIQVPHLVVDTDQELQVCLKACLEYLKMEELRQG